jgi:hypothetical protein
MGASRLFWFVLTVGLTVGSNAAVAQNADSSTEKPSGPEQMREHEKDPATGQAPKEPERVDQKTHEQAKPQQSDAEPAKNTPKEPSKQQ